MLENYFRIAFRILLRQKAYSIINIFGLTLGVACTLLISLYIVDDLRFDKFHPDIARIYRVGFGGKLQDTNLNSAAVGLPVSEALLNEVPQIDAAVRLVKRNTYPVRYGDNLFTEKHFLLADANFFEFFNFPLISGNKKEVLSGPNKVVITEKTARRYFDYKGAGDTGPLGKIFIGGSGGQETFEVTGIAENPPAQSHIQFDFVLSLATDKDLLLFGNWVNTGCLTYFKIKPGTDITTVTPLLSDLGEKHMGSAIKEVLGVTMEQFRAQGNDVGLMVQPMEDVHLRSSWTDDLSVNGNIQYVYLFGATAIFIILLACINFMNLSTARSANRAKEVGIRKTAGALRQRLIVQFLLESYIYVIVAVLIALAIVGGSLNIFNYLTAKSLSIDMIYSPLFIGGIIVFTAVVGMIAGSYPAFYLTNFKPAEVLKGKVRAGMKTSGIRNTLVIFQFFISITLIISSMIVYKQLHFLQETNIGFNKANVVNLLHTANLGDHAEAFRHDLLQLQGVEGASFANRLPPNMDWSSVFRMKGTEQDHLFAIYMADHEHLQTMGYSMLSGRYFDKKFAADSAGLILNEVAARELGLLNDYEGKTVISFNQDPKGYPMHVIGIMKDFNFETLRNRVKPLAIILGGVPHYEMAIRLSPGNTPEKIASVESLWKKYVPQAPFEYSFLDENFDALFRTDQRMGRIILIFTVLAIVIACLGLFGLASFTAEQRAKEVSIRKVLGATITQVLMLLSKDFTKLVAVAFVLAVPVTWYAMTLWLEGFAYRIAFDVVAVIVAGSLAMTIAILTISVQAFRAAIGNPVDSLRSE